MKQLKGQFQLAVFCQDYSTPNPKYFGYYNPNDAVGYPYFTETSAQEIVNDYAKMNREQDNDADILYWKGKDILFFNGIEEEENFSLFERIKPVKIKVGEQVLTAYGIGHNVWSWERAENSEIIEKLAREYATLIRKELTPEQLHTVNTKNATQTEIDYVHDYCDGNQVLLNAWEKVICRDYNFESDMDRYLHNAAVKMAIDNKHWV